MLANMAVVAEAEIKERSRSRIHDVGDGKGGVETTRI